MIKLLVDDLLVIGLSSGNLELLQQKKPIYFCLHDIHPDFKAKDVLVMWSHTEEEIIEELKKNGYITPETIEVKEKRK